MGVKFHCSPMAYITDVWGIKGQYRTRILKIFLCDTIVIGISSA